MNNDNPAFWQDLAKKAPAGCRILSPTRRSGAFFDFVNDLISDEKSSWSKPIRAILSVTAVPVHLPVIKSYYEVRKPHDHNSACFTGLFIVRSLWTFREEISLHPGILTYCPYANQSPLFQSHCPNPKDRRTRKPFLSTQTIIIFILPSVLTPTEIFRARKANINLF